MMALRLRKCCVCLSPRTGTAVLGCLGVAAFVTIMVPEILLLQDHDRYVSDFVRQQRQMGVREIRDEDIPSITFFSRVSWSLCVAYDVIIVLSSILLLAGASTKRRYLLVPWLTVVAASLVFLAVMVLAAMIGQGGGRGSLAIFIFAAPVFGGIAYCWLIVFSTFHQMRSGNQAKRTEGSVERGPVSGAAPKRVMSSDDILVLDATCGGGGGLMTRRPPTATTMTLSTTEEPSTTTSAGGCDGDAENEPKDDGLIPILEGPLITRAEINDPTSMLDNILDVGAGGGNDGAVDSPESSPSAAASDDLLLASSSSSSASASGMSSPTSSRSGGSGRRLRRAVKATPPPTYEAVAIDIDKEQEALANGLVGSQDLIYFQERRRSRDSLRSSASYSSSSASSNQQQQQLQQQQQQQHMLRRPLLQLSHDSSIQSIEEENEEEVAASENAQKENEGEQKPVGVEDVAMVIA